ncbi:MAG: DUF2188 domain-containing protein [Acidobacteria bacterium]|nr:DUF2188 domain-containing protein [Acidobacteriota bacterium]
MSRNGIHVVPDEDTWWVLRDGESRAPSRPFSRARDAIRTGRSIARAEKSEFTLYDQDGRVRAWKDFS